MSALLRVADARDLGDHDGREEVEIVLQDRGLRAVLRTLIDGCIGWDEGAINAGAFETTKLPKRFRSAYYEAYAAGALALVNELASETHACPECGQATTRHVMVRGTSAGECWDDCPDGHTREIA